jgi:hypothetical protein
MSSFANMKRGNDFEKLQSTLKQTTSPQESGGKDDSRFWNPSVDKAGNGMAIVRFLPAPAADGDEGLPWVRVFKHGFQGPGGWLIDDCLTTINGKCPVCENNSVLWNSGVEANKGIARDRKRKLTYIANILVLSDPSNPENEGQIKLFKFGKKIFDKLNEAMNPEFADETPLNPFDFWKGANFKLKMRNVEGYRNYDKSEFDSVSALFDGNDDKLETLWKKEYSLAEFIDPTKFKTYDQIKDRLDKVLGGQTSNSKAEDSPMSKFKDELPTRTAAPKAKIEDDDDDMNYFKSLANAD